MNRNLGIGLDIGTAFTLRLLFGMMINIIIIIISYVAIFFFGKYFRKIFKKTLTKPKPTKASSGGKTNINW